MPADITFGQGPIEVCDPDWAGLPFSKGLMATSILATGLETDRAYAIAAEIQNELFIRRGRTIEANELANLAATIIEQRTGSDFSTRFRAWREVKNSGRPVIIALGGVPGVGKSTLATRLAVRLGITHLVTTDTIREVLRTVIPKTVLAELHTSTYEVVDDLAPGETTVKSFYRQARAVGSATAAVANRLVTEGRSVIVEGVHLVPGKLRGELEDHASAPIVVEVLLVLPDADRHRHFLDHRIKGEPTRGGERHVRHFDTIRKLQTTLRDMAQQAGVPEFDVTQTDRLTQFIVDQIVASARIKNLNREESDGPVCRPSLSA